MGIFVVFRVHDPLKMKAAIEAAFPNDHIQVNPDEWLISSAGTAIGISEKLGISDVKNDLIGIVFGMSGYYGRASNEIWDWIKAKAESADG